MLRSPGRGAGLPTRAQDALRDTREPAPPPPRQASLRLPRPPPLPVVPSFPRASRGAALLSPPSEAPGLRSLSASRVRHSFPSWGLALLPFRGIRFSATESFSTPSALRRGSPATGYPRPSLAVNISPDALCRGALGGTPLPQRRMGKQAGAKRHSVTLGAECQWPGGPTGNRSFRLGRDSAMGLDAGWTNVAHCPRTRLLTARSFSPVSLLV